MPAFWRNLLHEKRDRPIQGSHPALGLLDFDPDEGAWVAAARRGEVSFLVGGKHEPDALLLDRTACLFTDYDRFHDDVRRFLEAEANASQFRDEIRRLTVTHVCYYWPDRPEAAMVFFAGPDHTRVWHADYVDEHLSSLTFDS